MNAEKQRLQENRERKAYWTRWGCYVAERQWGTVREDYSEDGSAWDYFSHEQSLSRAYRWGEDGIAGICDNHQRLCFALAFWNEQDPIIKEKMFGVTSSQGNHGEDVKEYYFYLDNTPTHSYMKYLYKYPQTEYPYERLVKENQSRGFKDREFELLETGIFDEDKYFDIFIEYAKESDEDILIKVTAHNRGDEEKPLHMLPTLWFRNTWSWYEDVDSLGARSHSEVSSLGSHRKPELKVYSQKDGYSIVKASHFSLGERWLYCNNADGLLFTENETNNKLLFGSQNASPYVKDGINNYVVKGDKDAVNPDQTGTKFSAHYQLSIPPGKSRTIELRLCDSDSLQNPFANFDEIFTRRIREADEFYHSLTPQNIPEDYRNVQRQAFAGMLWNKQFYYYVIEDWLKGDPTQPSPPEGRKEVRNREWKHLFNNDIISMPDKWEYPYYCVWDTAFHMIPLAILDPDYAKLQLSRMTREWYMHPNGQIPAYEWNFNDVNPPVVAWAAWQIYNLEQKYWDRQDKDFLERIFQKLLLNFTWWVNRQDAEGKNIFEGGFLGMDNIGVFNRSSELPTGGKLEQADGTSWMAMYCLGMLKIALELAVDRPPYEDTASKFFEHFLYIADAMNRIGGISLWDDESGFFYDAISFPDGSRMPLKVRSLVGLVPLLGVTVLEPETIKKLPGFEKRLAWFINNRPDLKKNVACMVTEGVQAKRLLALCYATQRSDGQINKLQRLLTYMLDESEFMSPHGIRSVSKYHKEHPFVLEANGEQYSVQYEPAESPSGMFGGNSNWRGPVWFPLNYLILEALQNFHNYLGEDFKIEFPTGSEDKKNLYEIAVEIANRMMSIFLRDSLGNRPVFGEQSKFQNDPYWRDYVLFHEYFNGDNGAGLGSSHQTGWTGVVAHMIQLCAEDVKNKKG